MYSFISKIEKPEVILDHTNDVSVLACLGDNNNLKNFSKLENRLDFSVLYGTHDKDKLYLLKYLKNQKILNKFLDDKNFEVYRVLSKNLNLTNEQKERLLAHDILHVDADEKLYNKYLKKIKTQLRLNNNNMRNFVVGAGMPQELILKKIDITKPQISQSHILTEVNTYPQEKVLDFIHYVRDNGLYHYLNDPLKNINLIPEALDEILAVGEVFCDVDLIAKCVSHRNYRFNEDILESIKRDQRLKKWEKKYILVSFLEKNERVLSEITRLGLTLGDLRPPVLNEEFLFSSIENPEEFISQFVDFELFVRENF